MTGPRLVRERHQARAVRLAALQQRDRRGYTEDEVVREARATLWAGRPGLRLGGPGGDDVVLRSGLILRHAHPKSPLLDVAAPRSAAVQLLLVALFVAQCRTPARDAGRPTPLPLRHPLDAASTSWRYLVALPTTDTGDRRPAARTDTDNRIAQLRTALTRLHQKGRVELAAITGRGRFEGFKLLDESTYRPRQTVPYTVPSRAEHVLRIPVAFFLNGWVHALTDGEIAAYLFLLLLQQHRPPGDATATAEPADTEQGMLVPRRVWSEAFGGTRAHIGYRMLYRYGLIRIFRPAGRRDDGTIEDFHERDPEDMPHGPLHFVVDLDALQEDALTQVVPAVTAATTSSLDEAWAESQGMTF